MAVSRGGVAFWVGCVRSYGRRQSWTLGQAVDSQCVRQTSPLSGASWALKSPNSMRCLYNKQPVLSHLFHNVSQSQKEAHYEEDWDDAVSVCVLVQPDNSDGLHTLFDNPRLAELFPLEAHKFSDFTFALSTVDGSREDDISIIFKRNYVDSVQREHGCFRSLFEAERCPAPFMCGSQFYCFHCPGTEPLPGSTMKTFGLNKPVDLPLLPPTSLFCHSNRPVGEYGEGDSEGEEKLSIMYERLRVELPNFFLKNHDYTMYSNDLEFINGLINTKTRGRLVYQLTISVWRLLCLCYYAEAQLEVLKLTKHKEDGTIKARWRIRGLPFHTLLLRFYRKDKSHLYKLYDAFSTFYIGQDGLIHCHHVEKVMPAQPPILPRVPSLLAGALVALGLQEHRPALQLLPFLLSSLRHGRN